MMFAQNNSTCQLIAALILVGACGNDYVVGSIPPTSQLCEERSLLNTPVDNVQPQERSHWAAPWRKLATTRPAAAMREAAGLGVFTIPAYEAVVDELRKAGFGRVALATNWDMMRVEDPTTWSEDNGTRLESLLRAVERNKLRPKLRITSNVGGPAPNRRDRLTLVDPAQAGARQIKLSPSSAAQVAPGRTGLLEVSGLAGDPLITSVGPGDTATLSRPLRVPVPAGTHTSMTFAVVPFPATSLPDGRTNPAFDQPLMTWLAYVAAVTTMAERVLNTDAFDVDLGNPATVGFSTGRLYQEPPEGTNDGSDAAAKLMRETVGFIKQFHPTARIGDLQHASSVSSGVLSKYAGIAAIERTAVVQGVSFGVGGAPLPGRSINAQGTANGAAEGQSSWREAFTPKYNSFFPEASLHPLRSDALLWDFLARAQQAAPLEVWMLSLAMDLAWAQNVGIALGSEDKAHIQVKAALRFLSAFVGVGATATYLFAPLETDFVLFDPSSATGKAATAIMSRFMEAFAHETTQPPLVELTLTGVAGGCGTKQFLGDGSLAHPDLTDQDVVAFFPFQASPKKFVIPVYVMTRDMLRVNRRDVSAQDPSRFDLPEQPFVLSIAGLPPGSLSARVIDPILGEASAVEVQRTQETTKLVVKLVDWPRILVIEGAP